MGIRIDLASWIRICIELDFLDPDPKGNTDPDPGELEFAPKNE